MTIEEISMLLASRNAEAEAMLAGDIKYTAYQMGRLKREITELEALFAIAKADREREMFSRTWGKT